MSSTLSRSIRRIGILPTTYRDTQEQRLVKGEDGKDVEKTITIRKATKQRLTLNAEQFDSKVAEIRAEHRLRRKAFKQAQKAIRKASKSPKLVPTSGAVTTKKKAA